MIEVDGRIQDPTAARKREMGYGGGWRNPGLVGAQRRAQGGQAERAGRGEVHGAIEPGRMDRGRDLSQGEEPRAGIWQSPSSKAGRKET
jgi:hypothetical protein